MTGNFNLANIIWGILGGITVLGVFFGLIWTLGKKKSAKGGSASGRKKD